MSKRSSGSGEGRPEAKAARLDEKKTSAIDFLRKDLAEPDLRRRVKEEFTSSQPYSHFRILPLADEARLRAVHDELVHNLTANLKESDLFKVYQTCDLANLGRNGLMMDLAKKMPELIALRDALYSDEFKSFVQEVTGCGELSDKVDCATNLHTQGCHLLVHDDVIGTRKVSYIIYLTNPDEPWGEEDGGCLELYGAVSEGTPKLYPSKSILPTFNSMAMFLVKPGESFHAVQEVFAEGKPRMSIQGWFHGPEGPSGKQQATVNQLLTEISESDRAAGYTSYDKEVGETGLNCLSEAEVAILEKYVHPDYLKAQSANDIRAKFEDDSCVVLHEFLKCDVALALRQAGCKKDSQDKVGRGVLPSSYTVGEGGGWNGEGPTHKQRFLMYTGSPARGLEDESIGELLMKIRKDLFESGAFAKFLYAITGLEPTSRRGFCRRFRPGIDYTVAHYGTMTSCPRLSATLCFVDDGDDDQPPPHTKEKLLGSYKQEMWASGEIGGFECYIQADEEAAEASDVYKMDDDDDGPLVQTLAKSNTLSLVLQDEGVMRFVKYVGGAAPGSRFDVTLDFLVRPDEGDEDS